MAGLLHKTIGRLRRGSRRKRLVIMVKALDHTLPSYQARIPINFEVLPSDVEEVEVRLAHIPPEHRPDVERRIHSGHRCCVAKHRGAIIYVSWIAFGTCYSYALDREYELAQDEAYAYGAYTLPRFRGNGTHPAASCHRLQLLEDWGYKREFAFMEPENSAAMRMPERLGYDKAGVTGFVEVFGFRWYFHRDRGAFSALRRHNYWRKV
jgi:hypothetical protein